MYSVLMSIGMYIPRYEYCTHDTAPFRGSTVFRAMELENLCSDLLVSVPVIVDYFGS